MEAAGGFEVINQPFSTGVSGCFRPEGKCQSVSILGKFGPVSMPRKCQFVLVNRRIQLVSTQTGIRLGLNPENSENTLNPP